MRGFSFSFCLVVSGLAFSAAAQSSVLTYHNNNARTGANLSEVLLAPTNVNSTSFGKLAQQWVDGYIYAQPLYAPGVNVPGKGIRNLVFVATEHNSVYAFDANSRTNGPASLIWQINLGPSAATPNSDFGTRYGGYTAIVPEVGITGTPVIDLSSGTLYVDAFTHEGGTYFHRLHALNISDGTDQVSPVVVAASIAGVGAGSVNGVQSFVAKQQLQRSALTLAGGRLYVAFAGYDDTDPYHGWIIGFDPATFQPSPNYVFNTTPNSTVAAFGQNAGEGGIWMGGGGLAVDSAGSLFFEVGNGSFNAFNNSGGTEYGDSFIRLSTNQGLAVADYFTPYNQAFLGNNDLDVGSSGLVLLPDQSGAFPRLLVGGGKQGTLYVLNRDMLTTGNNHYNSGGSSDSVLQSISLGGGIYSTAAAFNNAIYCAASGDVLARFLVSNGSLSLASTSARKFSYPGATPSLSANGGVNGIVWAVQNGSPAVLAAYDAADLSSELYNSTQAGARDALTNGVKFAVPTVADGKVFVGGQYALTIFGLFNSPTQSPYDAWRVEHFGANVSNPSIAGDLADPDADQIPNIWEYAMASDPNRFSSDARPSGDIASNTFQFGFNRNVSATDLTYHFQMVDDLVNPTWVELMTYTPGVGWVNNESSANVSESSPIGSPPDQYVSVVISQAIFPDESASGASFFRLLIEKN